MKIFNCPTCSSKIYFENEICQHCGTTVGFSLQNSNFVTLNKDSSAKYCANHAERVCNWIVEDPEHDKFCTACAINRTVPSSKDKQKFNKWRRLEVAKHRLIFQLHNLQLDLTPKSKDEENGLAFDFLAADNKKKMMTGHANGVITIILKEADSVHRELIRKQLSEPYRTLIGHFRHESGHFYWPLLFKYNLIDRYRELFGDDREKYGKALKKYYAKGAPANWNEKFISKYATSHSWEDWAETWAHYLHIMDILETAHYSNISIDRTVSGIDNYIETSIPNPYITRNFKILHEASVILTTAVNSLNRSMGVPDIYPFTIPQPVIEKLTFIHDFLWELKHGNKN